MPPHRAAARLRSGHDRGARRDARDQPAAGTDARPPHRRRRPGVHPGRGDPDWVPEVLHGPSGVRLRLRRQGRGLVMADRETLFEHVMEPGTGKAVPVLRGQILRIEQIGNGQCADFNAFNLHDYKEHFHTGRTRHLHGLFPQEGDMLWSAPPRERPMFTIIRDTVGTNDIQYPRCTGFLYEYQYGFDQHTNCHDILAESIREYGLTPDDVHDSFNFWMHVGVDPNEKLYIKRMMAKPGD